MLQEWNLAIEIGTSTARKVPEFFIWKITEFLYGKYTENLRIQFEFGEIRTRKNWDTFYALQYASTHYCLKC